MNKIITIVLAILLGVGIGWIITKKTIKPLDPIIEITENTEKIDSLIEINNNLVLENEKLRDSIKTEVVIIEKTVKVIKTMPIDSGTLLLKENLLEYGELTKEEDTLPAVIGDSIVGISRENLIDINLISARFGSTLNINKLQEEIIKNNEVEIENKSLVILEKDEIIRRQTVGYEKTISDLKEQAKIEKRRRLAWEIGGITVSAGLVVLFVLAK